MNIDGKVVAVTGGARGIGAALCEAFVAAGAKGVAAVDLEGVFSDPEHNNNRTLEVVADVSHEGGVATAISAVQDALGPIDIFCSNAGILTQGGVDVPNEDWQHIWNVNVMSHVWAARHLVPDMAARGGGYLLNTASAAGLLNQIGSAPYGVTKHAAVGLAEWLAMTHGDQGIGVSVLCPQGVRTPMIAGHEDHIAATDGILEPEDVANAAIEGIRENRFLITPHAQVRDYFRNKAADYDRWVGGMRKLNRLYSGS